MLRARAHHLAGVLVLGYVDQTGWLYDSIDVVINTSFSGSGLKIKTVDALARGKLLITTPTGIEGIDPPVDDCCLIAQSPEEFGELMLAVLERAIDVDRILANLDDYMEGFLSPEARYRALFEFLGNSVAGIDPKRKVDYSDDADDE